MTTANALSSALDAVLNTDTQAVTPAGHEAKVTDAVADAAKAVLTPPSDAKADAKKEEAKSEVKDKNPIPYDRFAEVIEQKNKAVERLNLLEQQFNSATQREDLLRNRLGDLEKEHQILEAIRVLGKDQRYADAISKIDRALQGIEEEVETAKATGDDKAQVVAESKLAKKTEELETMLKEQRNQSLMDKSQDFATSLLDTLPEEYTELDKTRIGKMWSNRVDWNKIEERGAEVIPEILRTSLAELIKDYGTPQGALVKQVKADINKEIPEESRIRTPDDVIKAVLGKQYGEVKEGKATISDDEFANDMAVILKAVNRA